MACKIFLLLALVAGSLAGPISVSQDRSEESSCTQACPVTDLPKQGFKPGMTYRYSYEGASAVEMENVYVNSSTTLELKLEVELAFISTCQAVVSIVNPVINGHAGDKITTELLASHPMVVTMSEGVVTSVCAHPEDHPTGLNLKKGIMSTIQNSLPNFETTIVSQTIVETDILGKCPTQYTMIPATNYILVEKTKDHLECAKVSAISEAPVTSWWLRAPVPFPMRSSNSTCRQVWNHENVLQRVNCTDVNIVEPFYGSPKIVIAIQWSALTLLNTETPSVVPVVSSGRLTNLTFEEVPQPKTVEVVQRVEDLLVKLCSNVDNELTMESSKIVAKIISLLHRVPEETITTILKNIQSSKYCKQTARLESIYQDAILFINNGGAVEVMVEQVVSGKVSGGREPLYAIALQLMKRPCLHAVKSVSRLFDSSKASSSIILAAGTLVNKYCKYHPSCMTESAVNEIMDKLNKRLDSWCSSTKSSEEKKIEVLTVLKSIGNMANISRPLERSIVKCVKSSEADIMVRVAAAQSFRQMSCPDQPTSELVKLVLNTQIQTEVRIASYVAAIRCATYEESSIILQKLTDEPNTQVRSFILSHMRNIQKSDAPYLRGLRYNLSSLIIPTNFEKDFRMYSRNIDMSYYLPTIGVGAGIDTSIIYSPGSYIPRQYQANFTANLFDNVINIGEFAFRMEDIEILFEMVFGPKGFLHNKSHGQIVEAIANVISSNGQKLAEHLKQLKHSKDSHNWNSISHILNMFKPKEGQSQKPRVDTLIRLFGQEVSFSSLIGDLREFDIDKLIDKLAELMTKALIKLMDLNYDNVRLVHAGQESFIVTQQGIPLQIKLAFTSLFGFKAVGGISIGKTSVHMRNAVSTSANGFLGYTLGAKVGLRSRMKLQYDTPLNFSVEMRENDKMVMSLDIPKNETFNVAGDFNTYSVFKMPSEEDVVVAPKNGSYPVINSKDCYAEYKEYFGMKVCWDATGPDYLKVDLAPFGYMRGNATLTKYNVTKNIVEVSGTWKGQPSAGSLNLQLDFPSADKPTKGQFEVEYKNSTELKSLKLYVESKIMKRAVRVDIEPISVKNGCKYDMTIYSGKEKEIASTHKVLFTSIGGRTVAQVMSAEFELQTLNSLESYLKAHMEFDASIKLHEERKHVPRSIDLRKFEIDVAVPRCFRTVHFIRQKAAGANNMQYRVQSMLKTPSKDLYNLDGLVRMEGSMEKNNLNSSVEIDVKADKSGYKAEAVWTYSRREMRAMTKITKQGADKNIFLVDLLSRKAKSASSDWTALAKLEVPRYMVNHSVNGAWQQRGSNEYNVKMAAKEENEKLYEIEGPVTWIKKDDRIKEQCNLIIRDLKNSREFQVASKMNLSPEKSMASLDVKKNGKSVFSAEADFATTMHLEQLSCSVGVKVPEIIEGKVKVEKTSDKLYQMILNGFWRPNTAKSQKIKGASSIDLLKKEMQMKVSYDAEGDKNRMVVANLHYDYKKDRNYVSAKGDLSLGAMMYIYDTELMLGALSSSPENNTVLKIKVVRPKGEIFLLESDCLIAKEGSNTKSLEYKGRFQQSANKLFSIDSKLAFALDEAPMKMILKGRTGVSMPQMKEIVIVIDSDVNLISKEQKLEYKMDISGSSLKKPVFADVNIVNDRSGKITDVQVEISANDFKIKSKGQSKNSVHNVLEDLTMEVALQMPQATLYTFKTDKNSDKIFEISMEVNGTKILGWEHRCEEHGKWSCRLTVPSRVMEGHSRISSQEVSLSLYPHKDQNDEKYELSGHYSGSRSLAKGSSIDAGAKIIFPGNDKPIAIRTSVALSKTSSEGTLELDIFKSPKDKVFINMKTSKLDNESYKMAATFQIPTQSASPRIIAEAGLSPKVKMMRFFLEDGASDQPIMDCIVNYNEPADNHAYIYARMKTPSDEVEMRAALQGHEIYQCRGGSVNGTINFNNITMYDFASSACAPGYIEVGVKETSENKMYLLKLGMKNPVSIKVALDLVHNSTKAFKVLPATKLESTLNLYGKHTYLPKQPVVLLGATLWAPMMISLDAKYEVKEVNEYFEQVLKPVMHKLKDLLSEVRQVIPEDILRKVYPWNSFQLADDLRDVKNEIWETCHSLSKELRDFWPFPSVDDIKEKVSKWFNGGLETFKMISDKLDDLLETLFGTQLKKIQDLLKSIDESLKETMKNLYDHAEEVLKALRDGRDAMMKIKWMKWLIERIEGTSFWDWLVKKWETLKADFQYEIEVIENCFSGIYKRFMTDLKTLLDKISSFGYFTKFIKWLEDWLFGDNYDSILVTSVLRKFYSFYVDEKEAFVSVQIPLRQPVSSLVAAIPSIGVPGVYKLLWGKPSRILQSLTNPHRATARITKDNIVTFNGMVIPFLASKCQIKLTSACGVRIMATKASSLKTELVVQSDEGSSVKIHLHAGQSPTVDGLKASGKEMKKAGLEIRRISSDEVKVESECFRMTLSQNEVEVEAKPWAFNKVEGIMGTHDHEKSTDVTLPSEVHYKPGSFDGSHHLTITAAKRLLDSYKKDKRCKIPTN